MKYLLFLLLIGCTKEKSDACGNYFQLSDKYNEQGQLLRTDTLNGGKSFYYCGPFTEQKYRICSDPIIYEVIRYKNK
jgi:hypothetical protein